MRAEKQCSCRCAMCRVVVNTWRIWRKCLIKYDWHTFRLEWAMEGRRRRARAVVGFSVYFRALLNSNQPRYVTEQVGKASQEWLHLQSILHSFCTSWSGRKRTMWISWKWNERITCHGQKVPCSVHEPCLRWSSRFRGRGICAPKHHGKCAVKIRSIWIEKKLMHGMMQVGPWSKINHVFYLKGRRFTDTERYVSVHVCSS